MKLTSTMASTPFFPNLHNRFSYFGRFMSDQEAWHELCNLYLAEGEYGKAAFCMEEVLLHNPHSHLIHQRLAEIRYTMVIDVVYQHFKQITTIF